MLRYVSWSLTDNFTPPSRTDSLVIIGICVGLQQERSNLSSSSSMYWVWSIFDVNLLESVTMLFPRPTDTFPDLTSKRFLNCFWKDKNIAVLLVWCRKSSALSPCTRTFGPSRKIQIVSAELTVLVLYLFSLNQAITYFLNFTGHWWRPYRALKSLRWERDNVHEAECKYQHHQVHHSRKPTQCLSDILAIPQKHLKKEGCNYHD